MKTSIRTSIRAPVLLAAVAFLVSDQKVRSQVVYERLRTFCFVELSSALPSGPLTEGTNGVLYGLSYGGGQTENGTLFRLNKDGSGFAILSSFLGTNGDGTGPSGGLLLATNGSLYGTTFSGGYSNVGTVFRIDQDGNNYTVIRSFTGDVGDGASPNCTLIQADNGVLYGTTSGGGDFKLGTVFRLNADGSGYSVTKSFSGGAGDGAQPVGALVQGTNGMLLGTTKLGGTNNQGTIFTLDLHGNVYQIIRSFSGTLGDGAQPYAGLVQVGDGTFYGTTVRGGTTNEGTVFRLNQDGSGYEVAKRFTGRDGANPFAPLVLGTNGVLYGTTFNGGVFGQGTVFQIDPRTSAYKVIKSYQSGGQDGALPSAALMQGSDGVLYGTTGYGGLGPEGAGTGEGTAFKLNLDGSNYTVIWNFQGTGGDGVEPQAPLVEATNGCLYCTTQYGGRYGQGATFKINKDGSGYVLLRSFAGTNEGGPALPDGGLPNAGLLQGTDGALYGTTTADYETRIGLAGVVFGNGTIFKLNPDGTGYRVIKRFTGGRDGGNPYGGLIQATDGLLYGTTLSGSEYGIGVIFRLNLDGSGYRVLTNFTSALGYECLAGLLQGSDGALYGTTVSGGASGRYGTVFKLNLDGSGYRVLKSFSGGTGANPRASLIQGLDGALYGTAESGGSYNAGTVFKLNLDGSGFTMLKQFTGINGDGKYPEGSLVQASNGILYGTTSSGGANPPGVGTVFQLKPDGTGYLVLRSFVQDFYDGILPTAGLIQGSDGALYGTTSAGGRDQNGTVYSLVPPNVSPVVTCPSAATVECGTPIELTAKVSDPHGDTLVIFWAVNGEIVRTNSVPASHSAVGTNIYFEAELPLGTNVVEVSVSDQATNTTSCSTTLTVVDTTAPVIVSAIASPSILWPPNHQMVPVNVRTHVTDNCGPTVWKIVDVRSNEPVNARGAGSEGADWVITGDHTLNLRVERSGKGASRIYSIIIQATDASGNLSGPSTVEVTVPKNQGHQSQSAMRDGLP